MNNSETVSPVNGEFITKDDVAGALHVSKRTVSVLMAEKKLPYYRFNARLIRFKRQDVSDYLDRMFRVKAREV